MSIKLIQVIWLGLCLGLSNRGDGLAQTVQFVDVTADLGIYFVHQNGASQEKRLPEAYGSGGALFDYDGDGDLDLYLVNSGDLIKGRGNAINRLYRNDGQRFTDVTAEAGVPGREFGMGVVAGDYDNDGDADLYLTNWGEDILYRNEGDGRFTDVTQQAGLGNEQWGSSAAFLDYDDDGDLDLFVVNYVDFTIDNHPWCGHPTLKMRFYCDPHQHQPTQDILYRNEGDGRFTDASKEAGIVHKGNGLGVVCWDYDDDGDQDVYVTNDMDANFLYENQGSGYFEEIGLFSGTALSADGASLAGMGVDTGDYDNDGDLDLFVTNYQLENNTLYRNDGFMFSEVSFQMGIGEISLNHLSFGTGFLDYDNDGWQDLFITNGHVHDNIEEYDEQVTYAQKAQMFHNEQGRYVERSAELGSAFIPDYVGRGAAFGDYDRDGDMDIVVMSLGRSVAVLRNDGGNARNWLQVDVQGTKSNRDGIGTKVYLQAGALRGFQQVKAGSGYQSSSQKALLFGLGDREQADRLEIRWPSGKVQVLENVAANQILAVVEPHDP